MTHTHTNMRNC